MADTKDSNGAHAAFDTVRDGARQLEPDRYLAALLSPRAARHDAIALAAFIGEINKIAFVVSEPHLAEIRLQWWRDAVIGSGVTGNLVADAINPILSRNVAFREQIGIWLDAVVPTFYTAAPETEDAFLNDIDIREGVPFQLTAQIYGAPFTPELEHAAKWAGRAYGLARLGLTLAQSLVRGRMPLPEAIGANIVSNDETTLRDQQLIKDFIARHAREAFGQARLAFRHASAPQRASLLPLALVEPYLRALEKQDHDLTRDIGDVAPMVRVWRIWRAHVTGRL